MILMNTSETSFIFHIQNRKLAATFFKVIGVGTRNYGI